MMTQTFTLSFTSPAFLGDAGQNGAWRAPPIKALLRQWWRVAYAAQRDFGVDVSAMRHEEARLFGHAWLEDDRDEKGDKAVAARRSKVRLRLDEDGRRPSMTPPRIEQLNSISKQYLGYGRNFKANAVIQAGGSTILRLAFPDEHISSLNETLWLMDRFGTLGGRGRNGWGSFSLTPENGTPPLTGTLPLRNLEKCLSDGW
ncbi:MAG: hypothetical protein LBF50_03510, partial [Azoarcus sp.]|nr:hypothetical protein [Azoarcus sp.]